jgi:hypothetical protein
MLKVLYTESALSWKGVHWRGCIRVYLTTLVCFLCLTKLSHVLGPPLYTLGGIGNILTVTVAIVLTRNTFVGYVRIHRALYYCKGLFAFAVAEGAR